MTLVPPLLGPPRRPRRTGSLALCVLVLSCVIGSGLGVARAGGATGRQNRLVLTEQTNWLSGRTRLHLVLNVRSPLADDRLGIRLVLSSCFTSRSAFDASIAGGAGSARIILGAPPTIPLGALHPVGQRRRIALSVGLVAGPTAPRGTITRPNFALSCANGATSGVYPLEILLVDTGRQAVLASLTTPLVYVATPAQRPLTTALVLPFGARAALAPASVRAGIQQSLLRPRDAATEEHVARTLAAHRRVPVSLEIHSQLLVALSRTRAAPARAAIDNLRSVLDAGRDELLAAPFAAVDAGSLAGGHLAGQFRAQLARARPTFASVLHARAGGGNYVEHGALSTGGLDLLESSGVRHLVLPEDSYAAGSVRSSLTPTAPFVLAGASGARGPNVIAAGADPGLATYFAPSADPVLAAHNLLAELAQIYFDRPDAPDPRGIVVAPSSWSPNAAFLSALLSGLADSPVLRPATLSGFFSSVPVGANGDVAGATLQAPRHPHHLDAAMIRHAIAALHTAAVVVPSDKALLGGLRDSIFLAESRTVTTAERARYAGAARRALGRIGDALAFGGGQTITLTEQRARLPISILSRVHGAVHGVLELQSSELGFPPGGRATPLVLSRADNPNLIPVTARTSGAFHLSASFVSPDRRVTLVHTTFVVRSTAFSGVAIGISIAALAVLGVWWFRSVARHRRRARAERRAAGADS